MKKFLLILLSLSLFSLATISNAKTIRIGTEGAYPPWNNLNSAGDLEGAEIDFGNEACARMSVDCEWVTQDWDGIIPALLQGKYDIIIAGMSITEERKEKVNFTNGYMTDGARFAVLKGSGLADLSIAKKVNLNNAGGKEQAAMVCVNPKLLPHLGCVGRFLAVVGFGHAAIGEVQASVDNVRVLTRITCEGSAVGSRRTVSQFAKPVEHHPEVRISLVLRALGAQDGVRRGYIHGNAAADGLRSLRQHQCLQSLSELSAGDARCRF